MRYSKRRRPYGGKKYGGNPSSRYFSDKKDVVYKSRGQWIIHYANTNLSKLPLGIDDLECDIRDDP